MRLFLFTTGISTLERNVVDGESFSPIAFVPVDGDVPLSAIRLDEHEGHVLVSSSRGSAGGVKVMEPPGNGRPVLSSTRLDRFKWL